MTFEAMANAIRARFKLKITDVERVDVHHDNQDKEKPADKLWIRLNILPGETLQVSVGASQRYRTVGIVMVQIFLPIPFPMVMVEQIRQVSL